MSAAGPAPSASSFIKVVSHTGLFYWWPVWVVGFVLSALTYFESDRLAIVPEGTKLKSDGDKGFDLTVPKKPSKFLQYAADASKEGHDAFPIRISGNRNYGMVFLAVVLLVIIGSNVPLRGLWSILAVMAIFLATLLLAYFDMWDWVLKQLGNLHVYISLAGYLVPSVVLLLLWVASVFGFDQLRYIRFSAGQMVVHKDIGDSNQVYDTTQLTVQKTQSDIFRHWILGMGAGDLVVTLPAQGQQIILPNVLFVGQKVQQIANVIKTREVVSQ
jgi:hypothetical protein